MFKKDALTEIEPGLELLNFTWFINSVVYDWTQKKARIEIIFQEEGKTIKHSRTFAFDCLQDWTCTDALNAALGLDILEGSNLIDE